MRSGIYYGGTNLMMCYVGRIPKTKPVMLVYLYKRKEYYAIENIRTLRKLFTKHRIKYLGEL